MSSCKIGFDVLLSSTGNKATRITVGIEIHRVDSNNIVWQQLDHEISGAKKFSGTDARMPARGRAEISGGDLLLYRVNGSVKEAVARLTGFSLPPGAKGGIDFDFIMPREYPDAGSRWRGKGEWTLRYNDWVESDVGVYGSLTGLSTGWKVSSTGGVAAGIGPSWTFNASDGDMLISNNSLARGKEHKLHFTAIGGGWGKASGPPGVSASGTYSRLSWPTSGSWGDIYFGTLATRLPMEIDDFTGPVTIVDGSVSAMANFFPLPGGKQIKLVRNPFGLGAAASVSIFFFGVPPAIGAIPVAYKAATIVWGLSPAASVSAPKLGASGGGGVDWLHGYAEIEDGSVSIYK